MIINPFDELMLIVRVSADAPARVLHSMEFCHVPLHTFIDRDDFVILQNEILRKSANSHSHFECKLDSSFFFEKKKERERIKSFCDFTSDKATIEFIESLQNQQRR